MAEIAGDASGWTVTFADSPAGRGGGNRAGSNGAEGNPGGCGPATPELMRAAVEEVATHGGGLVQVWVSRPRPDHERTAASLGLNPARVLYQMRRPLPYDLDPGPPLATRPFRPGVDETEWLGVNNRAFSWHPEQGGWTPETIEARKKEPWFDPEGFLVHEDSDGRIDGFCWTKVHSGQEPVLGEIYAIAVDPDPAAGRRTRPPTPGLGRQLTAAGLHYLHHRRGIEVGMLYVDGLNTRAVKLYVDMRFVVNHVDQVFAGRVGAQS